MNNPNPVDVFLSAAEGLAAHAVQLDASRALFPGGRNGPYFDIESPVRNTAHALAAMAIAHRVSGSTHFADCGRLLAGFLLSDDNYLIGGLHVHRHTRGKDSSNGIIGPAWVIEALAAAGRFLDHETALRRAAQMADAQPFDEGALLWQRLGPDGRPSSVDRTLNHQVAFAVALQSTRDTPDERVTSFLHHLESGGLRVESNGLLVHHVPRRDEVARRLLKRRERALRAAANSPRLATIRRRGLGKQHPSSERDLGYHLYTLFCLARLKTLRPIDRLWESHDLTNAVTLAASDGWLSSLDGNPFAYPYNAPGFELPLVANVFHDINAPLQIAADAALRRQLEATWDGDANLFAASTPDPLTLSARCFELGYSALIPTRTEGPHT